MRLKILNLCNRFKEVETLKTMIQIFDYVSPVQNFHKLAKLLRN